MEKIFVTIYVGNLSYQVTQEALKEVFAEYGAVKNVVLPIDRESGKARGFGFVELEDVADEQNAIDELDGAEWMGRVLKVNKAKPKETRSGGGGGGGGGGGRRNFRDRDTRFNSDF